MILGLSLATFTVVHVLISLIAIASGLVVLAGMFGAHRLGGWTALFLVFTLLTNLTGFFSRSKVSRQRSAPAWCRR